MSSFEYIKENKTIKLDDKLAEKLAIELSGKWKKFDDKRKRQLDDAETILNRLNRDAISEIEFNDTVDTDSIYELHESLRANLRKHIEHNIENFSVFGRDKESHDNSPIQKESIIFSFRDMKFKDEAKKILDDFMVSGELIAFTGWYEKVKQVRRQQENIVPVLDNEDNIIGEETKKEIVIQDQKVYEGVKCNYISYKDFVYDVYAKDFDSALKIQRNYVTYDDIKAEQNFKLSEDAKEALNPIKTSETESNTTFQSSNSSEEQEREEGKVKLYECWGDIKLKDGTLLKNYLVVIANEKYIIRFEPNPYIINPYTIRRVITDNSTLRGVSLIKVAIGHSVVSAFILSKMLKILWLVQNPPWIGPEGAKSETGETEWEPGKYYGFDEWTGADAPIPVKFDSSVINFKFIDYFKSIMQSTTGIFPYMAGIQDETNRTATESGILINGQQVRLMMNVDEIQDFILDLTEKTAELKANYMFDNESLPQISDDGQYKELTVTPDIRQGNYKYDYTDKRSFFEKQQEADKFLMGIKQFAEMGIPVNGEEAFKYYLENQEIKNVDRFITIDPIEEQFKRLPPEEQQRYKPIVAELIKQQIDTQEMMNGQPTGLQENQPSLL